MQQSSQQSPTQGSTNQGASGAAGELKSDAQQLGNKAANRLHSEVDARKDTAVSQVQSVSSAIEQTAGQLDDNAPAWLKSAFTQGAQKIQQFADTIEQKDSRQLMSEAQSFARNNPGTFLAACAAAGFAAARIFKAGGEQQSQQFGQGAQFGQGSQFDSSQQWGSGEQDQFGQDELMDDTLGQSQSLGQGQRSSADASSGQSFMARPETQSPTSEQFRSQDDDPLTLGTGGDGGARIPGQGDFR